MSEVVVRMIGVKRYFDQGLVQALKGIDLQINHGESVGIAGPSGSGKSTLLNLAASFDFATAGTVELFGCQITPDLNLSQLRNRSIGFIFQLHNLLPHLTLTENVMLPLYPWVSSGRERLDRARGMLDRVGLGARSSFLPVHVSGGERQRAAIARALINDPALIIGDEPTGNLDHENGQRVLALLQELTTAERRTLMIATHNSEITRGLDRVITLADGQISSGSDPCRS